MNETNPRSVFVPHRKWLSEAPADGAGVGPGFLFLMVVLAAVLRFHDLNGQSLWVDEIATWRELRPGAGLVFHTQVLDSIQGPLYLSVLWPLVRTFAAETVMRVPAAVAGVLTVAVFGAAAGRWLDQRSARIATFLLAVSPFHVWYSQEARGYAFLLLFVVAMGFLFREMAAHGPTVRKAGLFALASAGAVLSNMSGVFMWAALGLSLLVMVPPRTQRDWGLWSLAFGLGLVIMTPWLLKASGIWAVDRIVPGAETGAALRAETTFSLLAVPYSLFTFLFGHTLGPSLRELHQPDRLAVVKAYLPLLVAGAVPVLLASVYALLHLRRRHLFLLVWVVVPLALLAVLAVRNIKPWNPRYGMVVLPWLLLFIGYGLGKMPRRLGGVTTLWLAGLALWSLGGYYWDSAYAREDVRGAAAHVAAVNPGGDPVLVPVVTTVFEFYYHGPAEVLDTFQETRLSGVDAGLDFVDRRLAGREALWLVESRPWFFDPDGVLPLALARRGHLRLEKDLPGVRIYHWESFAAGNRDHDRE